MAITSVILITLLSTSYAYACYYYPPANLDNLNIQFTQAATSDNEKTTNAATIQAQISLDHHNINVQIQNAYPGYVGKLNYVLKNTGNIAAQFSAPTIINEHTEAIKIETTNSQNVVLQPYQTLQGATIITVLDGAQQNQQYTFQIKNTATPKPAVNPRTSEYWKQQLELLIAHPDLATINPATLQSYLTQTSTQSGFFKFTGTQTQMFTQALSILDPLKNTNENELKQQLLALWLNQQAGFTTNYKIDGKTAPQIIQSAESALLGHQASRYGMYEGSCWRFNAL